MSPTELRAALDRERGIEELRNSVGPAAVAEFTSLIAETKPHLEGFFFDDEEDLWVMRSLAADDDTRLMDVYDPNGALTASARAALEPYPKPRKDGLVAGVVRDEFGVESIARYRIRRWVMPENEPWHNFRGWKPWRSH